MRRLALRILALLIGLLLLVTCNTLATRNAFDDAPGLHRYEITSSAWENVTVYLMCRGERRKVERQIILGETRRGAVDVRGCTSLAFRIELLGRQDTYRSDVLGWTPGTTLQIHIMNHLPLTNFLVR